MGRPVATHCKRNHPLVEGNLYHPPSRPEERWCWTCSRSRGNSKRPTRLQETAAFRAVIADQADRIARLEAAIAALSPDRRRADGGAGARKHRRVVATLRKVA